MILPLVSELLGRVARLKEVDEALDALQRNVPQARLSGLTDSAKALVAALAFAELGHTTIILVDTNQRAEALLEPVRWFYRAVTGKSGHRVGHVPAHDVLPYENRSPHAEISEDRAVALWHLATGEADVLIVPVQAALWRMREPEFYRRLARTIARDESIAHEDLIGFLIGAGYEKQTTCEMPGQFAVRGGIIDVFSPESIQPVRIELLGDTIESIRAYDPNTQRSTNPVERTTLLPLTEFVRGPEVLEQMRVPALSGREDGEMPAGFYPGWEFREMLRADRRAVLFDLVAEPILIEDEPSLLKAAVEDYRVRLQEAFDAAEDPLAEPPERYIFNEEEWLLGLELSPRLGLEHLGITEGERAAHFSMRTQPTARYHGNVAAFMAEVRGQLAAGESVVVSAASTGELERFADICNEYEVPYLLGELEESMTVARLAEESGGGSGAPPMVLTKAPLAEGISFTDARLSLYGNADLFETLPPQQRPRSRPKTGGFFSDFSDLKPGDFVVHVDHGIGQFEGLRQVSVEGASGEFMLLRFAGDAKLYVPLARLDLVQKYQSLGGVEPTLD
jgi:transcription-repair coupling factor (superfamily II helicase)